MLLKLEVDMTISAPLPLRELLCLLLDRCDELLAKWASSDLGLRCCCCRVDFFVFLEVVVALRTELASVMDDVSLCQSIIMPPLTE